MCRREMTDKEWLAFDELHNKVNDGLLNCQIILEHCSDFLFNNFYESKDFKTDCDKFELLNKSGGGLSGKMQGLCRFLRCKHGQPYIPGGYRPRKDPPFHINSKGGHRKGL